MRYNVTYAFNGYLRGAYAEPVRLITETVAEMRREGVDIEFLGATQEINPSGQLIEATARYSAPSKGTVGRLNCRACLPASGPPQHEEVSRTGTDHREPALAPR
ncbi:MAG: hypothetical protein V5A61_06115 [Haloarculaceae archaeon]